MEMSGSREGHTLAHSQMGLGGLRFGRCMVDLHGSGRLGLIGSSGVSCGVGTCWFGGVDDGGDGDGVGRGGDVVDGDGVDGDGEWFGFGVDGLDRWGVVEGDCRGGDGDGDCDCDGWWSGMGMFV